MFTTDSLNNALTKQMGIIRKAEMGTNSSNPITLPVKKYRTLPRKKPGKAPAQKLTAVKANDPNHSENPNSGH